MFYTYMWLREDGTPYYVGKGKGNRAYKKKDHRHMPPPTIDRIVFYIALDEADAFATEELLVWYYGRKDLGTGCLRNLTDGGEGPAGKKVSKETRTKQSQSRIGKDPWNKGLKGAIPWNKGLKGSQVAWNKGLKSSVIPWNKGKGRSLEEKRAAHNIATKKHYDKKRANETVKVRIPWNKGLKGSISWNAGTAMPEEERRRRAKLSQVKYRTRKAQERLNEQSINS